MGIRTFLLRGLTKRRKSEDTIKVKNVKYKEDNIVSAVYDNVNSINNPFIEAMPGLMSRNEFKKRIGSYPPIPYNLTEMSKEERREKVSLLNECFIPMDYMYEVYDFLYRGICLNYKTKNTVDYVRKISTLYYDRLCEKKLETYVTQSFSGALLGVPGIGKTSTIRRSLSLLPQVILHENYNNEMFYCKQITYLVVECPHDCSVKTLAYSIINEIDKATGSDYLSRMFNPKGVSTSSLAIKVKIICLNNHVGIIVIDEIQNVIQTAFKNKQVRPLIKFLVELTNEACVSLCFSGTLEADDLFKKEEHLMRRTEGYRLLPLKQDRTYYEFLRLLWQYQMTQKKIEFDEKLANKIYCYSKGIPAYIVKIFQEAQIQAILNGKEIINESMIKMAISKNNLITYNFYGDGISISDFCSIDDTKAEEDDRKRRGRPIVQRDTCDLIMLLKSVSNSTQFISLLKNNNLLDFQEE